MPAHRQAFLLVLGAARVRAQVWHLAPAQSSDCDYGINPATASHCSTGVSQLATAAGTSGWGSG